MEGKYTISKQTANAWVHRVDALRELIHDDMVTGLHEKPELIGSPIEHLKLNSELQLHEPMSTTPRERSGEEAGKAWQCSELQYGYVDGRAWRWPS